MATNTSVDWPARAEPRTQAVDLDELALRAVEVVRALLTREAENDPSLTHSCPPKATR